MSRFNSRNSHPTANRRMGTLTYQYRTEAARHPQVMLVCRMGSIVTLTIPQTQQAQHIHTQLVLKRVVDVSRPLRKITKIVSITTHVRLRDSPTGRNQVLGARRSSEAREKSY